MKLCTDYNNCIYIDFDAVDKSTSIVKNVNDIEKNENSKIEKIVVHEAETNIRESTVDMYKNNS